MKKKVILIFITLLLTSTICDAEEKQPAEQKSEDNIAAVIVQKQPHNENQKQKITKNTACIIIQINGKIKENEK